MDLSIALIGLLGFVGYNLNKDSDKREYTKKREFIPNSEIPNGNTVYDSEDYVKIKNDEQNRANDIISVNNTIKQEPNQNQARIPQDSITEVKFLDKQYIFKGPMFNNQKSFINTESEKPFNTKETFNPVVSDLSGKETDFSHNNMMPFFGGTIKSHVDSGAVLNKYTGKDKPRKQEKVSDPLNGRQEINGMRAYTDLVDRDRYESNVGRYVNNVVPFKQYKEAPIRPETLRVNEKNIDELRTSNNQKISGLPAQINHGAGDYKRPLDPIFNKNKTDTYYEENVDNLYPSFVKNTEAISDNRNPDYKYTSKMDTTEATLNLNPAKIDIGNVIPLSSTENNESTFYVGSKRQNYETDWVRNARMEIPLRKEDIQDTYTAYRQERETTSIERYGNANTSTKEVNRDGYNAKITNKEITSVEYSTPGYSQNAKNPLAREFYEKSNPKTKPSAEYIPGGVKKFAPQRTNTNISFKNKPVVENYKPIAKKAIPNDTSDIGKVTNNKKFRTVERDFSYRVG